MGTTAPGRLPSEAGCCLGPLCGSPCRWPVWTRSFWAESGWGESATSPQEQSVSLRCQHSRGSLAEMWEGCGGGRGRGKASGPTCPCQLHLPGGRRAELGRVGSAPAVGHTGTSKGRASRTAGGKRRVPSQDAGNSNKEGKTTSPDFSKMRNPCSREDRAPKRGACLCHRAEVTVRPAHTGRRAELDRWTGQGLCKHDVQTSLGV